MNKHKFLWNLICIVLLAGWSCQPKPEPVNGAPGIGDPFYPELGNGGYDVQNYTIALDVEPLDNTLNGSTTIYARPTESLSSFNLDFHALTVDSVLVDNSPAEFTRDEDEMTITPSKPLESNIPFSVAINYHGTPELVSPEAIPIQMGWSLQRMARSMCGGNQSQH